jgi:hypothetical protein
MSSDSYTGHRGRERILKVKNRLIIYLLFIIFVYKKIWEIKKIRNASHVV